MFDSSYYWQREEPNFLIVGGLYSSPRNSKPVLISLRIVVAIKIFRVACDCHLGNWHCHQNILIDDKQKERVADESHSHSLNCFFKHFK